MTERDLFLKCNDIMESSVLEVSFLYDLKEYFVLKNKLEILLDEKNKIISNSKEN